MLTVLDNLTATRALFTPRPARLQREALVGIAVDSIYNVAVYLGAEDPGIFLPLPHDMGRAHTGSEDLFVPIAVLCFKLVEGHASTLTIHSMACCQRTDPAQWR